MKKRTLYTIAGSAGLIVLVVVLLPFFMPAQLQGGLAKPVAAPEIESAGPWLNSPPLSMAGLKGRVVLLDFWTYSCINCLRTLPYIKSWYEAYKDKGFVVVGIHAPEFEFEKNTANVEKAIKRFGITYPVVQDNAMEIWNRYGNRYWPAHYLINRDGQVVYTHFGEGNYAVTENNIRALLRETGETATLKEKTEIAALHQTPETYLGTDRGERFESNPKNSNAVENYVYPEKLDPDCWALQGKWERYAERVVARDKGAALQMRFRGRKLFLVMGVEGAEPVRAKILFNGAPLKIGAGKDVTVTGETFQISAALVQEHRLYELLDLGKFQEGTITIQAEQPGLQLYAFTFGG